MTASPTPLRRLLGSARAAVCPWLARFERRLLADDGARWFHAVCCTAGLEPGRPPEALPRDTGQNEADLARHIAAAALLLASGSRPELPLPTAWYEDAFVLVGSHAALPWAEVAIRAAVQLAGDEPCAPSGQAQRRIGRYELLAPIGFGASSTVYRAVHADSGRHAAVKLMRLDSCDPDHVLRFRREARFAAALHHPGIAQVLDSGVHTEGGLSQPYLVFELIEGQPFSAFAAGRPLELVLRTFADVCAAVHHAHQNGIVHRDLKPANVLVDAHGAPHVLDFGVATSCGMARSAARTATGSILGTPSFMSPEQARGSTQDIGPTSDVFGLGAILFDALVGSPPFDLALATAPVAMRQVAEQEPRRIDVLRPDLPVDLVAIVRCALAVEPRERYTDAGALEADVRRHLAGEFVAARTPSRWRQLRRSLRRHRLLATALLALTVGATVSTAAWLGAARMERAYRDAAEEALDSLHTSMVLATELSELTMHSGTLRELTERTLASLEEMHRTSGSATTPRLRELERRLREVVADLQHRLGLFEPALEQRRRVVELARADCHGGFEATRELARFIVKLGDSLKVISAADGLAAYLEAHRLYLQNAADRPGEVGALDDLAWSHERLAGLDRVGFTVQDAALHARRFLELAEALVDRDGSPTRHHTLASALLFQLRRGEPQSQRDRLRFALRAVEHIQRAVELAPNRRVYRVVELGALQRLAGESELAGIDPGAVRSLFWQAVELGRELADSDPTDTAFAAQAVAATKELAEFEQRQGNLLAAERLCRQEIGVTGAGSPAGGGDIMALEQRLALAKLGLQICQTLGDSDRIAHWAQRAGELDARLQADRRTVASRR